MNQIPADNGKDVQEEQILRELQQILWNIKKECYFRRVGRKRHSRGLKNQGTVMLYPERFH